MSHCVALSGIRLDFTIPGKMVLVTGRDRKPQMKTWKKKIFLRGLSLFQL